MNLVDEIVKIMYSYILKTSAIGINLMAALFTVVSRSANAQGLTNFVELNQSRQFFDEGKERIDREIQWLQQDLKLQIKIPQHSYRSPDLQNSNSFYAEAQLQPMPKQTIVDDVRFSCSLWQIPKCDR